MSQVKLYIDCTSGVSGDMLCQCLTDLCDNDSFVKGQQQLVSDELHHEDQHPAGHEQGHHNEHTHGHNHGHTHVRFESYTNRSYQSILTLLSDSQLDNDVKDLTVKIYTLLAVAEAEVHGETLETVHFHEVGRPQAILNMVGIAAAFTTINPGQVYCSKIIDGIGTVRCAHGEISVPVPAVRALMKTSNLLFGTQDVAKEMVTPTGLAALLAMEPRFRDLVPSHIMHNPVGDIIVKTTVANGIHKGENGEPYKGLKGYLLRG